MPQFKYFHPYVAGFVSLVWFTALILAAIVLPIVKGDTPTWMKIVLPIMAIMLFVLQGKNLIVFWRTVGRDLWSLTEPIRKIIKQ